MQNPASIALLNDLLQTTVSVSMARSKFPHQTPNFLVGRLKNFLFTSCSPLPLCAQIANLDEEVFGIDCNRVARSWRV